MRTRSQSQRSPPQSPNQQQTAGLRIQDVRSQISKSCNSKTSDIGNSPKNFGENENFHFPLSNSVDDGREANMAHLDTSESYSNDTGRTLMRFIQSPMHENAGDESDNDDIASESSDSYAPTYSLRSATNQPVSFIENNLGLPVHLYMLGKQIRTPDAWIFKFIGDKFAYRNILCSMGQEFTDSNPSNTFNIMGIGLKASTGLVPFNRLYVTKNLVYIVQSTDNTEDYFLLHCEEFNQDVISSTVKILSETSTQELINRFPIQQNDGKRSNISKFFMHGVTDDMAISELNPKQMGVLMSFQIPTKSYIFNPSVLKEYRKSFYHILLKINNSNDDNVKNRYFNIFMVLSYLMAQSGPRKNTNYF